MSHKKKFELTEDQIQELREIFHLFDDEDTGEINLSQLRLKKGTFKDEAKRTTMRFPEFIEVMRRKMGERDTHDEMLKAYNLFDEENNGGIIFKGLKKVARELGEHMDDEELKDMITEGATEGNFHITTNTRGVDKKEPKVTLNEFMQIMEKEF